MFWLAFLGVAGLFSIIVSGYLDSQRKQETSNRTVETPLKAEDLPVDIYHYRNLFHASK